jgi:pimeloyl-ACP methyl ester carboxylesterase
MMRRMLRSRRFRIGFAIFVVATVVVIGSQWRRDLPLATLEGRWAGGASRFVDVDGMRVHYRDEGKGPALLLLHGTGASLQTWDDWAKALTSDGQRVVRLDLPGFGLTGPEPHDDYRIERYVEVLDHFLARLGIARAVVGGNSLGGTIAWRYAAAHPEHVEALILVDAGGYPLERTPPIAFRLGKLPLVSNLMAHLDPTPLVERTLRDCYGHPERVTRGLVERYVDMALRPGNRAAFGARTRVPFSDHTAELRALTMPTLILWGAQDRLIPVEHARRFARDLAHAELRVYDDLGHVPQEEDGARTASDVDAFVHGLPRG